MSMFSLKIKCLHKNDLLAVELTFNKQNTAAAAIVSAEDEVERYNWCSDKESLMGRFGLITQLKGLVLSHN